MEVTGVRTINYKNKGIPFHVEVNPPQAGLKLPKFYKMRRYSFYLYRKVLYKIWCC